MKKISSLLSWWLTPKFPEAQIEKALEYKPKGFYQQLKNIFRTWVAHPIKRRIAKYYLLFLQKLFGLTVVGITGSAGKTTTKEMLASILKQKGKTVYSFANIDPVYNIPSTILKTRPTTKYLVLEMGVEYPEEMDFYLWLTEPDIGVITNISDTHTEFFGNKKGVSKEKAKLLRKLSGRAYAVLNGEDSLCVKLGRNLRAKKIWFGKNSKIYSSKIEITKNLKTKFVLVMDERKISIQLPIIGNQFAENSLAAAAVGHILGATLKEIKTGLEEFKPQEHRMQTFRLPNGALVIDDTYNNNPEAAKKALVLLKKIAKYKKSILIFGDMLELGTLSRSSHNEIGRLIGRTKVSFLITVGKLSRLAAKSAGKFMPKKHIISVESSDEVISNLPKITKNTLLFIKGSRSIGLEKVVSRLPQVVR